MVSYHVQTPEEYLASIPQDRRLVIERVRQLILDNLPQGYAELRNPAGGLPSHLQQAAAQLRRPGSTEAKEFALPDGCLLIA